MPTVLRFFRGRATRGQHGIEQVISRDIYFVRQVDGIRFNGIGSFGGIQISFGNEGQIADLRVIWPSLKSIKSVRVSNPKELIDSVKNGRSVITPSEATTQILRGTENPVRITIEEATPTYFGTNVKDEEPNKLIQPYASLTATIHFPQTNYTVLLNCPLIEE